MTRDDQELASLRRAFAADSQRTSETAACPAPETIWEAVRGSLPPAQVREVVQHVALCPACAEDWRLARTLQEQEAAAAPAPVRLTPRLRRWRTWGLAAAAALAFTVIGVQWLRQPEAPAYREEARTAIRSQVEGHALPRDRFVLRWTPPVPAGAVYELIASTEDLQVIASEEGLRTPQFQVPASALKDLPSGARVLWKVEADLPAGGHERSQTFVTAVK
jgi:hypothetical protein